MSTLDNFKKEAKRWLKALRSSDGSARERLVRAYPAAPADPADLALRDIQHALALEHGEENWLALKKALRVSAVDTREERVTRFLQFACWDHHTHGVSDHQMYAEAALRLLRQHPEIARDSIYTAVVCGEIDEVERILKTRPELAREAGGARGWEPLLYLCYTRFPNKKSIDNALRIARALLDRGANPNAFYMAGDSSYSALVGVAGEGEQDSPRQPQAPALFELLLERGAEPFDIQVLYDTHFHCHILWWLKLVYESTVKGGRKDAWDDPEWTMLDMGGYGPGAYFILSAALECNDLELAEWALTHGASPNITRSGNPQFKAQYTLYERAQFQSLREMADLLLRYGAERTEPQLDDEWAFVAASLRLAKEDVRASIEKHPEFLQSPRAMLEAARLDRDDVVVLLLDLGVPINIETRTGERALHKAAGNNSLKVARLLLERGAEVDRREVHYNATPLGYAVHYWYEQMIVLLSRYSRDVWNLAFTGNVDRMRELFREDPALARAVEDDGTTLLWWLPEDETRALEIVELLLEYGADPTARSSSGKTAADWAMKRGMVEIARRLSVDDGEHLPTAAHEQQVQVMGDPPSRGAPGIAPVQTYDLTPWMILPVEMRTALPVRLFDGVETTTTDVWNMLKASLEGDLDRVRILLAGCPSLLHCDYNYMPPLHLAVREGHLELVRYLASLGAVNPHHRTYPYNETLLTVADDRGLAEIAKIIEEHLNTNDSARTDDENAKINYRLDGRRQTLENLVGANALAATEALIEEHPELVRDELACWGEGILAVPSNRGNREMVELLVRHGARVPQVSKWGREYFFKHYDIALFFLENGTDPNHLNCHHTTLLHSMAQEGNLQKARLLLDHGADLDPIDEEFRSTPLGLAARWGHREMVTFLLERGADPRKSGAPWAAPIEWARKKGHADIEIELRRAGA